MVKRAYLAAKRVIDVSGAAFGLGALAPSMAVIALLVRAGSDGPAFFGQQRVGRGGRPFTMWKFRTMVKNADRIGAQVTADGDPRITGIGKFLRDWKLDELPQLYNVLRGDMSLVGPRPEVQRYVDEFAEEYAAILEMRPGITDDASIAFRNESEILSRAEDPERAYIDEVLPRKIELYTRYVKSPSLRRDLSILVRTIGKIVTG